MNYKLLSQDEIEYIPVATVDDLPNGERLFLEIDGQDIVIFNVADQIYAIGDVCSHDNSPLGDGDLDQFEIVCPRHGARFDIRNGSVVALPAVEDIPAYPVRILDNQIEIGLPK